jgi:hypothetical protein
MKCAILIPDCHRPYHNKRAYNLMCEVAASLNPDEIVILGDYADFYAVSSHQKDPRLQAMLNDEVEDVRIGLAELKGAFAKSKLVYLLGNHEFRLERYLTDKAPALFGMTSVELLLGLDDSWRVVPYGPNQSYKVLNSYLTARHEPLASSAKATASKALCNLVYGHIHRIEESHIVGLDGTNHVCFSVGWLGDKRKDQVFSYVKNHHQWQLGFGVVYVDEKTKLFYHNKIHIIEHGKQLSCVVNGKRYLG